MPRRRRTEEPHIRIPGESPRESRLRRRAEGRPEGPAPHRHSPARLLASGLRLLRRNLAQVAFCLFCAALLSALTYLATAPTQYELAVGDVSPVEFTATRELVDQETTRKRAESAAQNVPPVYARNTLTSNASLEQVRGFYALVDEGRQALRAAAQSAASSSAAAETSASAAASSAAEGEAQSASGEAVNTETGAAETTPSTAASATTAATTFTAAQLEAQSLSLIERVLSTLGFTLSSENASMLLSLEESFYENMKQQSLGIAERIMGEVQDSQSLAQEIDSRVKALVDSVNYYKDEYGFVATLLSGLLRANVELDGQATRLAREAERQRVLNDPTMIPAGTIIIHAGDVISEVDYDYLVQLNLIRQSGVNYSQLFKLFFYLLMLCATGLIYLNSRQAAKAIKRRDQWLLLLNVLATFLISLYLIGYSVYAVPVYFLAIITTIYFGFEVGFVTASLTTLALLPIFPQPGALFPILLGLFWLSFVAGEMQRLRSNAWLIFAALLAPFAFTVSYGLIIKAAWGQIGQSALIAALCGSLCAIFALGIQPLMEILSSKVSASHLIKLAQPSQPLLRRLFLEAPGTYQHSMMVANLAEKGAEVIGADSLLVRVGTYYHDIGKMENPEIFTENQTDYNPHDYLLPQDSVAHIIAHVENGLRLARRYRLPVPLQNFITEHHGNTLQASFYHKACELAEKEGKEKPDEADYRYPWSIPGSRETAIVMLADSLEAAMRSTQTKDIVGAEKLARNIVKIKTEQNQLINSGLSYQEVEMLIRSFVQTYQGQFHERVRYPDARPNAQ